MFQSRLKVNTCKYNNISLDIILFMYLQLEKFSWYKLFVSNVTTHFIVHERNVYYFEISRKNKL